MRGFASPTFGTVESPPPMGEGDRGTRWRGSATTEACGDVRKWWRASAVATVGRVVRRQPPPPRSPRFPSPDGVIPAGLAGCVFLKRREYGR